MPTSNLFGRNRIYYQNIGERIQKRQIKDKLKLEVIIFGRELI